MFGFPGGYSSFGGPSFGRYRPQPQPQPQARYAPKPSRYSNFFEDDDDSEEEVEEEPEEIVPRQRSVPVNRKPQLPELEVEEHPGKGWLATARLGAGLTGNNIKLELEDDDQLIIVAQGMNRGRVVKQPLAFLTLPKGVDLDNVEAFVKNGSLNVIMPAKKQVMPPPKAKPINRPTAPHAASHAPKPAIHHNRPPVAQSTKPANISGRSTASSGKTTRVPIVEEPPTRPATSHTSSATTAPSPMTARRLQLANEEEDVFERALKYAIPD